jgi:uncharacterized lipoprotein
MSLSTTTARTLLATAVATALLASSGCSWMHRPDGSLKFLPASHNADYKLSQENRPLEVPPDLDTPSTDPSMQIPAVRAASAGSTAAGAGGSFSITDTPAGAWDRMGKALARIDGVTITQRSNLLDSYEVQYKGATFLLHAIPDGASTRIDAIGQDNQPVRTPQADELLGLLRGRLG